MRAVDAVLCELSEKLHNSQNDSTDDSSDPKDWRRQEEDLKTLLLTLSSLVGAKLLDLALRISSRPKTVVKYVAERSRREVYRVHGENAEYKVILVGYCDCRNFSTDRVGTALPICKHILAVHLAEAQQTTDVITLTDEKWGKLAWGTEYSLD